MLAIHFKYFSRIIHVIDCKAVFIKVRVESFDIFLMQCKTYIEYEFDIVWWLLGYMTSI